MAATTIFRPSPLPVPTKVAHYICESWWTCHTQSGGKHYYRERLDSLLSLGEGLSVIPAAVLDRLDLVIGPVKGWKGQIPTWFGSPCKVGRVKLWLAILEEIGPYREFSLLALFPRKDIEDAPPFVQLGTQFLLEYRAEFHSSSKGEGKLLIP
jgi:hypothetical protein